MANAASPPAVVVPRCQLRCSGTGTDRACLCRKHLCLKQACGGLPWPRPEPLPHTARRELHSHRLAAGGQHGRGLWAWCWSFFCWLPPSHGLAQACLHQGGSVGPSGFIQVCRHSCTERSHGNAHARLSVIAWQVGVWLQRLSHESILSMNSLSP